jgi:hypothetical protein
MASIASTSKTLDLFTSHIEHLLKIRDEIIQHCGDQYRLMLFHLILKWGGSMPLGFVLGSPPVHDVFAPFGDHGFVSPLMHDVFEPLWGSWVWFPSHARRFCSTTETFVGHGFIFPPCTMFLYHN